MQIRDMKANDVEAVARLWWLSWHGAHADILPVEVVRQRMLECFAARAEPLVGSTRITLSADDAQGFYTVGGNQVFLLFVALAFWRQGLGRYLLCDAEAALARRSYRLAWLGCYRGEQHRRQFL